jgi:hypothetical protein
MEVQTHDRSTVTLVDVILVQPGFRPGTIISMGLVNVALFCTDQESCRFVIWEIKCGDGYFPGFVVTRVDEFQGFLSQHQESRQMKKSNTV